MPYKDRDKQREAQSAWGRRNRDATNKHRAANRRRNNRKVQNLKEASPCTDCNKSYPYYVMQYDHLDSSTKIDCIGNMLSRNAAWSKIEAEIEKCELVCANCHAERTYNRV